MDRAQRLRVAVALNLVIVVVQVAFGVAAHSVALVADAGHNLADAGALLLSLIAVRWARRAPTERRSFGYHRGNVLAAQANAIGVLAITVLVGYEAIARLVHPHRVAGAVVLIVALIALVVNGVAALLVHERHGDLNTRAALLHLAGDAVASLGVAVAGTVMLVVHGAYWLDPAVSLAIGVLIGYQAVRLLVATVAVLLESTPVDIDVDELSGTVLAVPGVESVHDLHVWGLTDQMRMLSAHLLVAGHPSLEEAQAVGIAVKRALAARYGITHATLELECEGCVDDGSWCAIEPSGTRAHRH